MKPITLKETPMFKLYRKSQDAQHRWIRKHPVQYVALNAILLAMWIGYIQYKDRQEKREIENEIASQNN
jgi:hypothetical protein